MGNALHGSQGSLLTHQVSAACSQLHQAQNYLWLPMPWISSGCNRRPAPRCLHTLPSGNPNPPVPGAQGPPGSPRVPRAGWCFSALQGTLASGMGQSSTQLMHAMAAWHPPLWPCFLAASLPPGQEPAPSLQDPMPGVQPPAPKLGLVTRLYPSVQHSTARGAVSPVRTTLPGTRALGVLPLALRPKDPAGPAAYTTELAEAESACPFSSSLSSF